MCMTLLVKRLGLRGVQGPTSREFVEYHKDCTALMAKIHCA